MTHRAATRFAFVFLAFIATFAIMRLNFPEHGGYYALADARIIAHAKHAMFPDRFGSVERLGMHSQISPAFAQKVIKLSDDPMHLGRFIIIIAALSAFALWYLTLKKALSPSGAFLALVFALLSPCVLQSIDTLYHPSTDLILFFSLPGLLLWSELSSGLFQRLALALLFIVTLLGVANQLELSLYVTLFSLLMVREKRICRIIPIAASVGGLCLASMAGGKKPVLSPIPLSYADQLVLYGKDLLQNFLPAFVILIFAGLFAHRFLKNKNSVTAKTELPMRRFWVALLSATVIYEFALRISKPDSVHLPTHFYPLLSFSVGYLLDWGMQAAAEKSSINPMISLLGKITLAVVVATRVVPSLTYLSNFPQAIYGQPLWPKHKVIAQEDFEQMKIAAQFIEKNSTASDVWVIPERFGFRSAEINPLLELWSGRTLVGDGKHYPAIIGRLKYAQHLLNAQPQPGNLLILGSSHSSETDVQNYLKQVFELRAEFSTVYGQLRLYAPKGNKFDLIG